MIKKFLAWWTKCRHTRYGEGTGWYYGCFSTPVHGRYERHCLCCGRKEYRIHGTDGDSHWVTFR